MEALILVGLIFFFGIGFVFEILGFVFRILFSGFGLVIGLAGAAILAIVAVPILVGIIGFVIPRGLIILGIIFLTVAVINRSHQQRKDNRYNHNDYGQWRSRSSRY